MKRVASALCLVLVTAQLAPLAAQQPAGSAVPRLRISPAIFTGLQPVKHPTASQQPARHQPRSWMSRNWKWFVPVVAVGVTGFVLAATSGTPHAATASPGTG